MKSGRYTTELSGRSIEVDVSDSWLTSMAVLYVDGEQVAEGSKSLESIELVHDDVRVRVKTPLSGGVGRCELVLTEEAAAGDDEPSEHRVPLDPPSGTRAARLAEFQRERPRLYAARHVAVAIAQVLIAVLGIGVILRGLVPRIDLSWLPDIDMSWLPEVDLSWLPDPVGWLWSLLPDVSMPGWLEPIVDSKAYWVPVVIAVLVAANEVDKRPKANEAKRERDDV